MSDFQHIPEPVFPPNRCLACTTHACPTGFVDFMAEHFGDQLYVCAECVGCAALKIGWTQPDTVAGLEEHLEAALVRITELEAELEAEKQDKVVKVADLAPYIRRQQRANAKPAPVEVA